MFIILILNIAKFGDEIKDKCKLKKNMPNSER